MRKSSMLFVCAALVASAMFMSSCRRDEAPPVGGPELEEVGAIQLPAGIVAFGSVKSLTDITTAATDVGSAFNRGLGPLVGGQVSALVQGKLIGTRNLTWMDPTAPMRLVVLDPASYQAPFVFIGAVAYEDGLEAAMDEPVRDVEGNKLSYKGKNGRTMYVNRIGKYAIFTMEPGAFAFVRDFLKNDFLRHPGTKLVDVQASSVGFNSIVKPMVDARIAAADTSTPTAMDFVASELSDILDFIAETSRIRLVLGFSGGNLSIEGSALPVEGSTAARFAADGPNRKVKVFRQFPSEGWLEFASNVDPELFRGMSVKSMESISQFLPMTPEEKAAFEGLVAENIAAQSGEMAFQIGYEKQFPFRVAEVVALNDGVKGRETVEKTWGMLFTRFGALVNSSLPKARADGQPIAAIDFSTVQAAIGSSKEILGSQGVVAEFRKVSAEGLDVSAVDFSIDSTKFPVDDPNLLKFREVLGDRLSGGLGFDASNMYIAVGMNAVDDIARIRATGDKGSRKLAEVVDKAGFDVAVAARLSVVDAARIAAHVARGVLTRLPSLNVVTERPDLSVAVGSRDSRVVLGSVTIPVAGIAALMQPAPKESAPAADSTPPAAAPASPPDAPSGNQ